MSFAERKKLITKLEEKTNCKIITLLHSDRISDTPITGINTQISGDHISVGLTIEPCIVTNHHQVSILILICDSSIISNIN